MSLLELTAVELAKEIKAGKTTAVEAMKAVLEQIEKTEEKIEQLQSYVKGVRVALKQEEDNEIIKSIRSKKMSTEELVDFLSQIQDGSICLETRVKLQSEPQQTTQENKEEEF